MCLRSGQPSITEMALANRTVCIDERLSNLSSGYPEYLRFDLQNCLLYIGEPTFSMIGVKNQFENIEKDQHK